MTGGGEADEAEVFDFVDEYLRDRAAGESRPLAHYLARYPGHEEAISREYLALSAGAQEGAGAETEHRVGPYRLLSLLGRGGQGAVWLAEDQRISRRVALKVLPPSFAALSSERRQRLRREAESVSRLDHPGICPVYEAEIEGEPPYIAMRLVEGTTLAEAIAAAREGASAGPLPLPPRGRAELVRVLSFFERAARALHAAHEAGVVHRDVKPGNLMVTGEGAPVVLDFGQARDERSELRDLTLSGELFGTPAYMSPEQVRGLPVDRRTDVWSLAASLFEALTLARPFDAPNVPAVLAAIVDHPLARPSSLAPGLPPELDAVLEVALEKDPPRRYPSALELAEDLRRIREYEPVRARPAGPWLHLTRWVRRHPALALANAAVVLSLALGLSYSLHLLARERRALDYAVGRHLAERTLDLLEEDPSAALALGVEAVELAPNYLTRKALYAALDACRLRSQLDGAGARRILALGLDPRAPRVLAALDDGTLRLYERETGRELARVAAHEGAARALALHPAGELALSIGDDGALRAWRLPGLELAFERRPPGGAPRALALDAAGARVAVVCERAWSWYALEGGAAREGIEAAGAGLEGLALSPDGTRALTRAGPDASAGEAVLWALEGGLELARLGAASCAAFAPDGAELALGGADGTLRFVTARTGAPARAPLEFDAPIATVTWSPDGARLALSFAAAERTSALVVERATGATRALGAHDSGPVVHVAFSPAGERLATCGFDMTVRVWDVESGAARALLRGFIQPLEARWSRDGRRLVTLSNGPWADVWYAASAPDLVELVGHGAAVGFGAFSPDGARVVTASRDGTARVWRAPSGDDAAGELALVLEGHAGAVTRAWFVANGALVVTLSEDGTARLWDAERGAALGVALAHGAPLVEGGVSADGEDVVALGADGAAFHLAARPGTPATRLAAEEPVLALAFAEGALALGTRGGAVLVHELRPGEPPRLRARHAASAGAVVALAFGPRAEALALACEEPGALPAGAAGRVRFVRAADGAPARPELVVFSPRALDWSADGARLLVTGERGRGAFRLQDLERDVVVRPEVYHRRAISSGCFSADGALVATTSLDGSAYVRDARDGQPVVHLALHSGPVLHAAFAPAGSAPRVLTTSADGTARLWPLAPAEAARARLPRPLRDWELARERRLAAPLPYR